jgi:hypothetical protein
MLLATNGCYEDLIVVQHTFATPNYSHIILFPLQRTGM